MAAAAEEASAQKRLARHLRAMGLEVRPLEGDRTLLAALPIRGGAFPGLDGEEIPIKRVLLSSLGFERVKCLRPRALFQLPPVRILGCGDARAIEERIRVAWRTHLTSLGAAKNWLDEIGVATEAADGGSTRVFQIEGEGPNARATVIDRNRIVVPSTSCLSGISITEADGRCFQIDPSLDSSIEFEIALTTHMEHLARQELERLDQHDPYEALRVEATPPVSIVASRTRCVLLVGPKLADDQRLAQKLRRRDFEILTARSEREAVAVFDRRTPDLVLADADQGRADGIELVVRLANLTGIENAPVVLVDDQLQPGRRETARKVGAAGYLVRPLEIGKLASGLSSMIDAPRRRRYSRFGRRVAVMLSGVDAPVLTTSLGRRGMLIDINRDLPLRSLQRCRLSIPEVGSPIDVEAEVLYHGGIGRAGGLGVRFERFKGSGEAKFIQYLKTLSAAA